MLALCPATEARAKRPFSSAAQRRPEKLVVKALLLVPRPSSVPAIPAWGGAAVPRLLPVEVF